MGWKSTITIKREEAQSLIIQRILTCSDEELSDALEALGFGENTNLPYYGHNFRIGDNEQGSY